MSKLEGYQHSHGSSTKRMIGDDGECDRNRNAASFVKRASVSVATESSGDDESSEGECSYCKTRWRKFFVYKERHMDIS